MTGKQSFERWRHAVETTLPHKTVPGFDEECTHRAPGHTYAPADVYEAYTFHDYDSVESAKVFTTHIVTCWSGDSGPSASWRQTTFDQLVNYFENIGEREMKLRENGHLWKDFKALKELVESVHVCGYLGCGTWEHSHFCVIFKVENSRFVKFRVDVSGSAFFDTESEEHGPFVED